MTTKQWEDMELTRLNKMLTNEKIHLENDDTEITILKVPGGWIYEFYRVGYRNSELKIIFIPEK